MDTNLDSLQRRVIELSLAGKHVFITGGAGAGKSYVLRELIKKLQKKYSKDAKPRLRAPLVAMTGATGVSATLVNGCTLHSFFGLTGLDVTTKSKEKLAQKVRQSFKARRRIQRCKILVVDEISQVSADMFTKLEFIARKVRPSNTFTQKLKSTKLFGGIQVICCGDFCQIPPVCQKGLTFESPIFQQCFDASTVYLKSNYRQLHSEANNQFLTALNEIRSGQITSETDNFLQLLSSTQYQTGNEVFLFAKRVSVAQHNQNKIDELSKQGNKCFKYAAQDFGNGPLMNLFIRDIEKRVPKVLKLFKGMRIMLNANIDISLGLVNGAQGEIVDFVYREDIESYLPKICLNKSRECHIINYYEFESEALKLADIEHSRNQIPLEPCYALTIHKSQGLEFDNLCVDLQGCFVSGQAYTALSRIKDIKGLVLKNYSRVAIKQNKKIAEYYKSYAEPNIAPTTKRKRIIIFPTQASDVSQSSDLCETISIIPETPVKIQQQKKSIRFSSPLSFK